MDRQRRLKIQKKRNINYVRVMKKQTLLLTALTFALILSMKSVATDTESITLNPIAYKCVMNMGNAEEALTVRYEEGLKWLSFFAFNLSEIPAGSSIDSAVLKIKTKFVIDWAWVSAYSSSNAGWVQTGMSWDTKPKVDESIDSVWVDIHNEWYAWESSFFTDDVEDAFSETGELTVMLRSGFLIDQVGHIIFYPDAKLEITYTRAPVPETKTEIWELTGISLWGIIVAFFVLFGLCIVGVIVVIYFVRKRGVTRRPSDTDQKTRISLEVLRIHDT